MFAAQQQLAARLSGGVFAQQVARRLHIIMMANGLRRVAERRTFFPDRKTQIDVLKMFETLVIAAALEQQDARRGSVIAQAGILRKARPGARKAPRVGFGPSLLVKS